MKKLWVYIVFSVALLLAILWGVNRVTGAFDGVTAVFRSNTGIGAVALSDISPTMQLRTLSLQKELLVSQYRANPWYQTDEEIHVVYPGRIDIGFDLSKCQDDWLQLRGDSTLVHMPAVEILNKNSNYTGLADVKIEVGKWTAADMEALHRRANAQMLRSCEAEDCYRRAEELGAKALSDLLTTFGYKNITVSIDHRDSYGSYTSDAKGNSMQYWAEGGKRYLKFKDGSRLIYDGLDEYELLAFADLFRHYLQSPAGGSAPTALLQSAVAPNPRTQLVTRRGRQLQFSFVDAPWTTANAKAALTPYHEAISHHIARHSDEVAVELLDKNQKTFYRLK